MKLYFSVMLILLVSCASKIESPFNPVKLPDFSRAEIIMANQLLTRIFDEQMAPLKCVPDTDEASLLLRTLNPRMEIVQDDIEAVLDDQKEIETLASNCEQNCTCHYLDDLFREHLVSIDKKLKHQLDQKMKQRDLNSCLNYIQATFCQSEIYKALNQEKGEFSFEE